MTMKYRLKLLREFQSWIDWWAWFIEKARIKRIEGIGMNERQWRIYLISELVYSIFAPKAWVDQIRLIKEDARVVHGKSRRTLRPYVEIWRRRGEPGHLRYIRGRVQRHECDREGCWVVGYYQEGENPWR